MEEIFRLETNVFCLLMLIVPMLSLPVFVRKNGGGLLAVSAWTAAAAYAFGIIESVLEICGTGYEYPTLITDALRCVLFGASALLGAIYIVTEKEGKERAVALPALVCALCQIFMKNVRIAPFGMVISFTAEYIIRLNEIISTDAATGISTRAKLLKRLKKRIPRLRTGERLAFLFIDIDSFKAINDMYGHNEGDKALKTVAEAIGEISQMSGGLCARYGGDEFALAMILREGDSVEVTVKKIYDLVYENAKKMGLAFPMNVSIGCCEYADDIESINELIARADRNMYENKLGKRKKENAPVGEKDR